MNNAKATHQKERISRVLHKPENDRVLRRTFAASQVQSSTFVRSAARPSWARTGNPTGEPEHATESKPSSQSRISQDFTQIPARTTQVSGGLVPGATAAPDQEKVVGGVFDTLANIGNAAGAALGNLAGGAAAMLTGVNINTTDTSAPVWSPHGAFSWHIGFTTTGKDGWIVQRVTNSYKGTDSKGGKITCARVGATPKYYEAWKVDGSSKVSPSVGATNDMWMRPSLATRPPISDSKTKGRWSMVGEVYFTKTDPAKSGLTKGGVPDAGILLSGTTQPADLGIARLHRYANGTWDSTVTPPTHTGSNR